jgi:hypothetical protein
VFLRCDRQCLLCGRNWLVVFSVHERRTWCEWRQPSPCLQIDNKLKGLPILPQRHRGAADRCSSARHDPLNTEHPYPCFPYETVLFYLLFRHSANASRGAQWRLVTSSEISHTNSGDLTFLLTPCCYCCIVIDLFLNNQPDTLINYPNLFCYKTLHVSGIFSDHHQEFSTVHKFHAGFWWPLPSRVRMEPQFHPDMGREDARNMYSFITE